MARTSGRTEPSVELGFLYGRSVDRSLRGSRSDAGGLIVIDTLASVLFVVSNFAIIAWILLAPPPTILKGWDDVDETTEERECDP